MAIVDQEFESLHKHVLAIDPSAAGSLGRIARVKASVHKSFEQDRIAAKNWRTLIDELRLVQRRAVGKIKAKPSI